MLSGYDGPERVAGGLRRGAQGDRWGKGSHATRCEYVDSILQSGLAIGGAHRGVMSTVSERDDHWTNRAYGCHPAFVFLTRKYRDNYSWDTRDGDTEEPVWLEIDLTGLCLYADLWELHEVTHAAASAVGFWWGRYVPELEAAPELLRSFANEDAVVPYETLLDEAAAPAIELSRSAAILDVVSASRIKTV